MNKSGYGIIFRQSLYDFPCPVALGNVVPTFGLYRYKQGLRFFPNDDEGFIVRGDKRRLLYKGRLRSHRFTILGDTAFEYDCILEKEPESNVISLRMEGAEYFDFFRQPDFVKEPFLRGSYAVYKKETMVGEGTGKLCHIHRPAIIDARGRRCWGELAVVGNELRITIPEKWLGEAKYPVIVDPTVGTTTVGSLTGWTIKNEPDGQNTITFYQAYGVNKYVMPDTFNGTVTGYLYANDKTGSTPCKPLLYSDNNNSPLNKLSSSEQDWDIDWRGTSTAGWRTANFNINTPIQSGSNVWFGFGTRLFKPCMDTGSTLYSYMDSNYWYANGIPNTFPISIWGTYNLKISAYFTYITSQNYVRTLTQGVSLSDNRKIAGTYKRVMLNTLQVNATITKFQTFFLKILEAIHCIDNHFFPVLFVRNAHETIRISDLFRNFKTIFIGMKENVNLSVQALSGFVYLIKIIDMVRATAVLLRGLLMFVNIITSVFIRHNIIARLLKAKTEVSLKSCITLEIVLESRINEP